MLMYCLTVLAIPQNLFVCLQYLFLRYCSAIYVSIGCIWFMFSDASQYGGVLRYCSSGGFRWVHREYSEVGPRQ